MITAYLRLAANLLEASPEIDWQIFATDWTADDRENFTRALESWTAGTDVLDHDRNPPIYLVRMFLAAMMRQHAEDSRTAFQ